ncbi:replication initiation protein [Pseudoduganella sp. FT25W]|uniref:Replication initiation protein n=1 Tax=Duganella alba TaxID=2666081 RepID=A0A6L5QJN5_9BURK|nr:penicillin-insensitive murein endopeptidase [Duganella alba]MRX10003.1 replication initiation protein [Duganella alba]MRX17802.1 replication initiation protein [Duganella alba]
MRRLLICIALAASPGIGMASTCYGTVAHGRLEEGVQLPKDGVNFAAYSSLGVQLGRTYVHSAVREVVVDAYRALEQSMPKTTFVYGETGFAEGGQMRPHKTHQAGLSVDLMVPVLNAAGASVPLPGNAANKFGYGIEFDNAGKFKDLRIDYEAMAEHLYQLSRAAESHKLGITRVIFDPLLTPQLFSTNRGAYLNQHLHFMKERSWIRHDEHYHVDFATPCRPLR